MKKPITVAAFLTKMIELSGKSQREVAQDVGYTKPNVVSMMKQGQTKVPLEKAPLFAKACGVDPAAFTRLVMQEYWPDAWKALHETFGESLTTNERRLVEAYREICEGGDRPVDEKVVAALRAVLAR